nr:hypothetical protein [Tanacetum cinerariifolium]
MDSQFQSLKEEMHEMRKYYNLGGDHASKNDDTPMCERHEANYIQSEGYLIRNSHDSYSHQSHLDPNDFENSLTELNNDVRNDLEDFKRYEWENSQNISLEQNDRTEPLPSPQAHTEHVNAIFTGSGKSDYSLKILKDPSPPIIVNNKIKKDKAIKTLKKGYHVVHDMCHGRKQKKTRRIEA